MIHRLWGSGQRRFEFWKFEVWNIGIEITRKVAIVERLLKTENYFEETLMEIFDVSESLTCF